MLKIAEGFQIDNSDAKFGIFVDPRDNKEYPYKTFGTQTWMLKDLDYGTRVNVPTTQPGMTQAEGTCFKAKDVNNYGNWEEGRSALYILPSLSWAVPTGWHVPTKAEWTTLQNWVKEQKGSLNGYPQKALLGKTHWYNLTYAATDEYGFGLLPQGYMYRSWTGTSAYWSYVDTTTMTRGYWWTSTSTAENVNSVIYFYNNGSTFSDYTTYFKSGYNIEAFPIRLIKDATAQTTEPEIESISITIPSSGASDSKLVTEKAVKDYVDSQAGGSISIDSTDEVTVSGTGTQVDPYTFDLTGKLQSSGDVSIISTGSTGPTRLDLSGNGATSSISGSAKTITLLASSVDQDTPSFSAGSVNGTTYISGANILLPGYSKAYDTTDTHKILTRADTTGSIELASMSDLSVDGPLPVGLSGTTQHQLSYQIIQGQGTSRHSLYILDGDDPTDDYNWKLVSPFFVDYADGRKTKLVEQVTNTISLGNGCSVVVGTGAPVTIENSSVQIAGSSTTVTLNTNGLTVAASNVTTSVSPAGLTVTAPNSGNPITSAIDPAMVSTSSILASASSAPSNPSAGQMYYDTTLSTLRIYKNSAWEPVGVPKSPNVVSSNYVLTSQSGELKWEKTPEYYPQKTQYNLLPNQCSGYITTTLDRVYLFHMYGTIGITKPEFIRTILYDNGGTGAEFYAYIWRQSDKVMTHYGHLTLSSNTRNVKIPLTQLDTFDPESYWYGIVIHSKGTGAPRFAKGDFLSSSNYIDGAFSSGDAIPAEQNLQSSTTGPSMAIVGR